MPDQIYGIVALVVAFSTLAFSLRRTRTDGDELERFQHQLRLDQNMYEVMRRLVELQMDVARSRQRDHVQGLTFDPLDGFLKLRLVITWRQALPSRALVDTLQAVERIALKHEESMVEFFNSFEPTVDVRHAAKRLNPYVFRINRVEGGSLIIAAALLTVGGYILKETVGKTLSDAWKESGGHEKLKRLLLTEIQVRTPRIQDEILRELGYEGYEARALPGGHDEVAIEVIGDSATRDAF